MSMHHWTRSLKAVGLGLIAMAATATAQTKDVPGPIDSLQDLQDTGRMIFKVVDENNDGQISQKEAVDAGNLVAGGFFFRADANGDGVVTQDEAKAGSRRRPGAEADAPVPDPAGPDHQAAGGQQPARRTRAPCSWAWSTPTTTSSSRPPRSARRSRPPSRACSPRPTPTATAS